MIAILNYGMGNVGSIANMLKKLGADSVLTSDPKHIAQSDGLILPGVGAFDEGMRRIADMGLIAPIRAHADSGKPLLGVCLGMQLLGRGSEEGTREGLSLIPFSCVRFRPDDPTLRVPHMGWDRVTILRETPLTRGLENRPRYYFVHSYYAVCEQAQNVLMTCEYGVPFAAAVARGNIYGTQFHPEKSHFFGMALLRNFAEAAK